MIDSIRGPTSSRARITGSVGAPRTGRILAINSARSRVTLKKNFSPVMPALIMTEHRLPHLPVIDKGKLIGLISIGDLIKDVVSEQKFTIQQLQHYI